MTNLEQKNSGGTNYAAKVMHFAAPESGDFRIRMCEGAALTSTEELTCDLNRAVHAIFDDASKDFLTDYYIEGHTARVVREGKEDTLYIEPAETAIAGFLDDTQHNIAFLCGEPGAGKSTLARVIAYKSQQKDAPFPLCHYEAPGRISDKKRTISVPPETTILYLDGLDEAHYNSQKEAKNHQCDAAIAILKAAAKFSDAYPDIKIIIGGRASLMTALYPTNIDDCDIQDLLAGGAPRYDLLPLSPAAKDTVIKDIKERYRFQKTVDPDNVITADMRGAYIEKAVPGLPEEIKKRIIKDTAYKDISSEPLLLLLLLAAAKDDNGECLADITNTADLYDTVLRKFFERERRKITEKGGNTLIKECGSYDIFSFVLETVALCAFKDGDDRTASRQAVIAALEGTPYQKYFMHNAEASDGFAGIACFYFNTREDDAGLIEFVHKSFYEYFAAAGLLRKGTEAAESAAFSKEYLKIISAQYPSSEILDFAEEMIGRYAIDANKALTCVNRLLKEDMPISGDTGIEGIAARLSASAHAVLGYYGVFLANIKGSYEPNEGFVTLLRLKEELRFLKLTSAKLYKALLSGSDLYGADLREADLSRADLSGADLSGANLGEADLGEADLSGANLRGANLSGANLSGSDLYGVNLSGSDLSRANLGGADLSRADLSGADLREANLFRADLFKADLSGADLRGADLSRAILIGAYYSLFTRFPPEYRLEDSTPDHEKLKEAGLIRTDALKTKNEPEEK